MKKILVFLLGVIAGFLGLEVIKAPRELAAAPRSASAPRNTAPKSDVETAPAATETPALVANPDPSLASAATVRPASETPRVFFFAPPIALYGSYSLPSELRQRLNVGDRSVLLADAAFMARYREVSRAAMEKDLLFRQWATQLDPAKFAQVVDIATEQAMTWSLRPPIGREDSLARQVVTSRENAAKLAAVLSPEELETWAEFSGLNARTHFGDTVEAFAMRGLPQPTREQLAALFPPGAQAASDGNLYRTRQLDLDAAPESMNPQQRAYLANVARWRRAGMIVTNLNSTKVRDPEVWEIWPE